MDPEQHEQLKDLIDQLREAMLVQAATMIFLTLRQPNAISDKILEAAFQQHPMATSVGLVMALRKAVREFTS